MTFDLPKYVKERDEALLSMDEDFIRKTFAKWDVPLPDDPVDFWVTMHKARTGAKLLPEEERKKSRDWLTERGLPHLGDEQ